MFTVSFLALSSACLLISTVPDWSSICNIDNELRLLRKWCEAQHHHQPDPSTMAWVCEGLARLDRLHDSLFADLLHHRQTIELLHSWPDQTNHLLEDFLPLADSYSSFCFAITTLKETVVDSVKFREERRRHASFQPPLPEEGQEGDPQSRDDCFGGSICGIVGCLSSSSSSSSFPSLSSSPCCS